MRFWASAEIFVAAEPAQQRVRRCVEPFLNAAFSNTSLSTLDCELRYIPIIMPDDMRERYPARSKLRKKERLYDCAPQLDYHVFVQGSFEEQLREYLHGIEETASHLRELGATHEQVEDFRAILTGATERILAGQPSQTRH